MWQQIPSRNTSICVQEVLYLRGPARLDLHFCYVIQILKKDTLFFVEGYQKYISTSLGDNQGVIHLRVVFGHDE